MRRFLWPRSGVWAARRAQHTLEQDYAPCLSPLCEHGGRSVCLRGCWKDQASPKRALGAWAGGGVLCLLSCAGSAGSQVPGRIASCESAIKPLLPFRA